MTSVATGEILSLTLSNTKIFKNILKYLQIDKFGQSIKKKTKLYLVDLTFLFCLKYPAGLIRTLCAYENSQDPKSLCKTLTWKKKSNSLNHYIRLTGKWISPCQLPLEKGCLWSCRIKKSSITWWKYTYIWKWQSKNNSLFFLVSYWFHLFVLSEVAGSAVKGSLFLWA